MLDLKHVRTNLEQVVELLARRGHNFDAAAFEALDARRKSADVTSQNLQAERKSASKKIGQLVGGGMSVDEAKASVAKTLAEIEGRVTAAEQEAKEAQAALDTLLIAVPNLPDDDVPAGTDEADNVIVDSWGSPNEFEFEPKDHVDLGMALGGLDSEMGAKIAGSRFTVMSGNIARLHRALVQFMLDIQTIDFDCTEVNVPYIVNPESLYGTGNLPKFAEELFAIKGEQNFYLIPTAEVPVTNIARDRIFDDAELGENGIRFACHSACFRSEAGSYGRDTRGMIRQHQFEKVELVFLVRPDQSKDAHEALTRQAEEVLRRLELPYQKLLLCGGDMGASARRTYDLEVWLPGQGKYREISSCSNFGDYQARRMKARWKNPATGKNELLHTLNGSALAVGRTLVAVLENYQRADGSIGIPRALQPYMGGVSEISVA